MYVTSLGVLQNSSNMIAFDRPLVHRWHTNDSLERLWGLFIKAAVQSSAGTDESADIRKGD